MKETTATRTIKVIVKQKKTKEGRVFNVYQAVTKNGRLIDCKFRKEVTELPTTTSLVTCFESDMNVQRNTEYPCLWIKAVQAIQPVAASDQEHNSGALTDYFG